MDKVTLSTLGLFAVPQYRFLGSHKAFAELPVMQGTQRVSSYYKNLRATKFRLPPFLYKVISILFSNKAITLNTFPVLVFKRKAKKRNQLSFAFTSPRLLSVNILTPSFVEHKQIQLSDVPLQPQACWGWMEGRLVLGHSLDAAVSRPGACW